MLLTSLLAVSLTQAPSVSVGLLNAKGDAVVLQDDGYDGKPDRFVTAVCGANVTTVKFKNKRADSDDAATNWTTRNFDKLPGTVFTLGKKVPVSDDTPYCLLMTEKEVTAIAVKNDVKPCEAATKTKFEKLAKDKLTKCVQVATFDGGSFFFLDYARKKNVKPTVRFVAEIADKTFVKEIKASASEAPSCWRADDSCEFEPDYYRPIAVLKQGADFSVVTVWFGAEGNNVALEQMNAKGFKELGSGSFYNSP